MSGRNELLALAERCEAAAKGDRYVDLGIFAALWPERFDELSSAALYGRAWKRPGGWTLNRADWCYVRDLGVPAYTASLDAAMTLVPGRCGWRLWVPDARQERDDSRPFVTIWGRGRSYAPRDTIATTPALALTAAALRARAATEVSA